MAKDIDKLKETLSEFMSEVDAVKKSETYKDLNKHELRAVNILQLMEAEIGAAGQDLYEIVQKKRRSIGSSK